MFLFMNQQLCYSQQNKNVSIKYISIYLISRYTYYHSFSTEEIEPIIPPKASFTRNTRFSRTQNPHAFKWILTEQTHSPARLSLWHQETGTLFLRPSSQQHITFNLSRHTSTNIFNSHPIHKSLLISKIQKTW